MKEVPPEVSSVEVLAWIGEDELGSGVVGMKQTMTPKGISCLAAVDPGKWVQHPHVFRTMQAQADAYNKHLYLCRYRFVQVEELIIPSRLCGERKN